MAEFKRQLDYIDVATRLAEMREKFPELTMQQVKMEFVSVAGKDWVVYTAAAYRTPEDVRPGIGTAWEPIPGPTSFTRDSEVQNAETAAWGRALIAVGASTRSGIASAEEVTNRQQSTGLQLAAEQHAQRGGQNAATDEQTGEVDLRIETILKAAQGADNPFLKDIAQKYQQYGKLSEKQIAAAFKTATETISTPRSAPRSDPFDETLDDPNPKDY